MTAHEQLAQIAASPPDAGVGAFFDLDGTLVSGFTATVHAGHRFRSRQAGIGELLGVIEASVRYRLGRMEFERLLLRAGGYLRGESIAELTELGEYLFRRHIEDRVFGVMRDIVAAHQERGHTLALSSSALAMHVEPVARFLGIEHIVCNQFEVDDGGLLTGRIVTPIVWGPRKASAVRQFCTDTDVTLQRSYFYADGDEDVALMREVGLPRPVNPRPRLAAEAQRSGWPVLILRRQPPARGLRRLIGPR
jgi:HAD superfamily hydrolase (TIGR01490 family)